MFLLTKPQIAILLVVIAIVVIAAAVLLYLFLGSQIRVKRQVADLTKRYDKSNDTLTVTMVNDLKRLKSIADENVEYSQTYDINYQLYTDIRKNEDAVASFAIKEINRFVAEKKYKLAKENLEDANAKVFELENKCNMLSNSLGEIVNIDETNRQDLLAYRHQFSQIKATYELKQNELKYLEQSFNTVFEKVELLFIESDNFLSGAHYTEAKKNLPEIEKVLTALEKELKVLPKLVTSAFIVIPNTIDEVQKRYDELIAKGYPLHHLKVQTTLTSFGGIVETIQKKLSMFDTRNVDSELTRMNNALYELMEDFDKEVEDKGYFNENFDSIYNGSYALEARFIKLRRLIPKYQAAYVLKDSCIEELTKINQEISNLERVKRNLDNYVHSSSPQPYSILAIRLKELSDAMDEISINISKVQNYLDSLKSDAEAAFKCISEKFVALKKYESTLRQIDVDSFSSEVKSDITLAYSLIDEISSFVNTQPIDVEAVLVDQTRLQDTYATVTEKMNGAFDRVREAELSLVYANQFRQSFFDVKVALRKAEASFFEGDFSRCKDECIDIIKKNSPEEGKLSR